MRDSLAVETSQGNKRRKILVGVVIAVAVLGSLPLAVTRFLSAFGPADRGIRRTSGIEGAKRLQSGLEDELSRLREGVDANFATPFEKSFNWIVQSFSNDHSILVDSYRASPDSIRPDRTLDAHEQTGGEPRQPVAHAKGYRRCSRGGPDGNGATG